MGEGNKGRGEGSHNVCCIPKNNLPQLSHISRQEGIKSGPFSPSLSLCSPLMPADQPVGEIFILEPGVTVGRMPGADSLVFLHVRVFVCMHVCVCVAARVPLATSSSCESATACSNMHPELPASMRFLCCSHTFTRAESRYPVEQGKTPDRTYLCPHCQWLHTCGFVTLKTSKLCSCIPYALLLSKLQAQLTHGEKMRDV